MASTLLNRAIPAVFILRVKEIRREGVRARESCDERNHKQIQFCFAEAVPFFDSAVLFFADFFPG